MFVIQYSGSMYPKVPAAMVTITDCCSFAGPIFDNPKSETLPFQLSSRRMLELFTSQWIILWCVPLGS
ncbi:hypothetical protein HanRHA438_Chr13g0610181 [Helianthus annuus]|nr:hypothetical protein HanRHA438_Chr13g0610181 [Helianthus annuus]